MTIYLSVDAKNKFKAVCALDGIALGRKVEQIAEAEWQARLAAGTPTTAAGTTTSETAEERVL